MMRLNSIAILLAGALALGGGCATTGGSKESTHDVVTRIDQKLTPAVDKLNTTVASLEVRMEETDTNTRRVKTQMEELQLQLQNLQKDNKRFQDKMYSQSNLTSSGASVAGPVEIETPGGVTTPPAPVSSSTEELGTVATPTQTASAAPTAAPSDPRALYQAAQTRYAADDFTGAVQLFNDYLAKFPTGDGAANAHFWKAKSLLRLNRFDESITEFKRMRDSFPDSTKVPFAIHNEAAARSNIGQNQEAIRLLQEVIQKYPLSPAADQARQDLKKLQG